MSDQVSDTGSNGDTKGSVETTITEVDELVKANLEDVKKAEISAFSIVKMAGIATTTELKLIESKFDLLNTRIATVNSRLERALNVLGDLPTGSDFERIEAQLASVKTLISEALEGSRPAKAKSDEPMSKAKLEAFLDRQSQKSAASSAGTQDSGDAAETDKES
ncbi:MAG: hypothetical protein KDD53_03250 [Bdellovibrionales bacterium]|nr:hypothetical protein [Bdellovibrionales bacterium]